MWYAVQVLTGYELEVAKRIKERAQHKPGLIEDALACVRHVARMSMATPGTHHTYERIIPSYVFVSCNGILTSEAYQLLRSVSGIFRIFSTPISEQEMQRVFELREGQVEVSAEDVEAKAREFRINLRRQLLFVWERLRRMKVQAEKYYRGLREFLRVPSRDLSQALSLFPPARRPDPLTVFCLLVT
ncbi:transcription termination/antitermination NusG family protein [Moorellaceae bacterium AZ2]